MVIIIYVKLQKKLKINVYEMKKMEERNKNTSYNTK